MKSEDVKVYYLDSMEIREATNLGEISLVLKTDYDKLEARCKELEEQLKSETLDLWALLRSDNLKLQTANAALEQRVNELEYVEQVLRKGLKESQESDFNHRMEITTLEQKVKSLEEEIKQDYCDNAKRERELVTKLAVSEAKLRKAVEQRDEYIGIYTDEYLQHDRQDEIELNNAELVAITAESIAKTEGEK